MHPHHVADLAAEMEPDLRITGSAIIAKLGWVKGQCVRPGNWPSFEF